MSTTAQDNPFATAEAWETSTDTLLPVGNHICRIVEAKDGTAKSSGNPQLELKFENPEGSIRDWVSYNPQFLGKIVAVFDSAGVQRPGPGEFDPADRMRLSEKCIARLEGKQIGVIIREEDDNRPDKVGEKRKRVQGYVPTDRIASNGSAAATSSSPADDIPF